MDGEHPINIRGRVQRPRERQENVNEEDRELEQEITLEEELLDVIQLE